MDTTQDPGITLSRVKLLKAQVEHLVVPKDEELKHSLALTDFVRSTSEDGLKLDVAASFDLEAEVEQPPMVFKCTFAVRYRRKTESAMQWSEFSDGMALAHIIPYLREYVHNTTMRMPVPPLILGAINTHRMVAAWKERVAKSSDGPKPSEG